ncbi:glycosyltransferase family 4 protein [Flavobacteriaceae bacterium F89]|uniref:Glycosyltransferase family 4 protein n=1 Tax=Cerina litoralis TaxID=2874477 RepID=A0AAE3EYB8_9FLAO|nr:glycosyltransferase family 4 protein [Cerina litoralis]MCG2462604.1 glycosyltransferase family 4 protein [Cerina litoralis]
MDILRNINSEKFSFSIVLPPKSPFIEVLHTHGFETIEILDITHPLRKLTSYLKIFGLIRRTKPDLIFINQAGIQKVFSYMGLLNKTPMVSEVSTLEDALLVNKFNKYLFNPVNSFICNSEFIASKLEVPNSKKSVLYYGYEWKNLSPVLRKDKEPFKLVLLGRISESKGHFLLIEAVNDLRIRRPDIQIEVYFVGNAPNKEIEAEIRLKISHHKLDKVFVFRGFQRDINREIMDKNLMVIPSLQEPFGRIFCETAEAQLLCVVSDSGGLGELSKRFDLGILFESRNYKSLSEMIEYCYDNYDKVSANFKTKAHNFLNRLNKKEYISAIDEILSSALTGKDVSIKWLGNE